MTTPTISISSDASSLLEHAIEPVRSPGGATAQRPDGYDALVLRAQLLANGSRHADAVTAWTDAAAASPGATYRVRDLAGLGRAARLSGQWQAAEAAYREALALAEETFGADSRATAGIAHDLAVTCKCTGRFDDAQALYRRALRAAEACGDEEFAAVILHNLGAVALARGEHAVGVVWARRGVELRERLDSDALTLASDRSALAALLVGAGEHHEAERLLVWCRLTFAARLGGGHHEIGVVDSNLARLALARGDLDRAEIHALAALSIKESALGTDSPELAPTITMLGTIRRGKGDRLGACTLHRHALSLLEPAVDAGHPLLATIRDNLAAAEG
jgi:tetratricopeptide (TPR) repeat protein